MDFRIDGGNAGAVYNWSSREENGITYVTVTAELAQKEIPQKFALVWRMADVDSYSTLSPGIRSDRGLHPDWRPQKSVGRINQFMPVHQIVSLQGRNRTCIAVSDALNPTEITSGVCEFDSCFVYKVNFFTLSTRPIECYEATVRIDMRNVPYEVSARETSDWWRNECGYVPAHVPEAAWEIVDSTWYSFHRNMTADTLVKECELSSKLGMKTLIIDDGWQMVCDADGYSYCGDWEVAPNKMGDMRELTARIHALGMKVMVWFGVPFIGKDAKRFDEFKDMLLNAENNPNVYHMDPRFKKVREYLTDHFVSAVRDWDLDGLKLDFINNFMFTPSSEPVRPGMDYDSLVEAVDALMSGVYKELTAIRPEILIEFRQNYIGPALCKYGNMLRVADSPNDAIRNRADIINIRLYCGGTAVHSDMLMWHPEDSVESAAIQLADVLFAVPQISVRVDQLPEQQYQMLKYYLAFCRRYRDVLLKGELSAKAPECRYTQACSTLGDMSVAVCYADCVVDVGTQQAVVVNASNRNELILKGCAGSKYTVRDCMGNAIAEGTFEAELAAVAVPMGGMVFIGCGWVE